jgi:hypothetical protein
MNHAAYGHVPDPIRLCDAANLISREPACGGWSHQAIHEGLITAFWRGEFEQDGRSVVFTLRTPPGASVGDDGSVFAADQKSKQVTAENLERLLRNRAADGHLVLFTLDTPSRASVGDDENVQHVDGDDERLHEVMAEDRERVFWNRLEVVAALLKWDRDFIPPTYGTADAVFRALSTWSLEQWSSVARYMFWISSGLAWAIYPTGCPGPNNPCRALWVESA